MPADPTRTQPQPAVVATEIHSRGLALPAIALLAPVAIVGLLAWSYFRSFDQLMLALDRKSALGVCWSPTGVRPLCDFANHYYPQGLALAKAPVVIPGFYYSAFFAVCMKALATFTYPVARLLWGTAVAVAALALLLAPLTKLFRTSLRGCIIYGFISAGSLPLWHDLAFGQVSAITTVLVLLSFMAYGRRQPTLSAVLLGIATSIKFYPGLFLVYYLVRKDWRAVMVSLATVTGCMGLLPWLVLGDAGLLAFHRSLAVALDQFSGVVASTPYSNFIANAVTHAVLGRIDPASALYRGALGLGLMITGFHAYLLWRLGRNDGIRSLRASLLLGMASIPFLVRSCWVHYFVFLPLLVGCVIDSTRDAGTRRIRRTLVLGSVAVSAALVSVPLLHLVGAQSYYEGAWPFWSTALLLPGLYLHVLDLA